MWRKTGDVMGLLGLVLALVVGGAQVAAAAEGDQPRELISSPSASLAITKAVAPGTDAGEATFSFRGDLGEFRLSDGESATFAGLAPGSYTVAELLPSGWQLEAVTCEGVEPAVSVADAAMTVTLQQGQPAACTFYNYREQVAGPDLPQTGAASLTMPVLVGGLWALLTGLALAVWSVMRRLDRA